MLTSDHSSREPTVPATVSIRPSATDYAEYFGRYIDMVPQGDLVDVTRKQLTTLDALLRPLTESQAGFSYAPGKWTIREVVGHLTDTERVFAYRATAFSRGDAQPLPGYDQAAWNPLGGYEHRTMADLLSEWSDARRATVSLLHAMPEEALHRRGTASGREFTVLALLSVLPGHVNYHIDHLEKQYLSQLR